jgi:hypothetical protein
MSDQTSIRTEVIGLVKDDSSKLVNPDDYDRAINAALMTYSRHKPLEVIEDVSGAGTNQITLPSGWSPEFSSVLSIEYPVGEVPPEMLDQEDFIVIDRAGTVALSFVLATTDTVRVTFTMLRTSDDIPDIALHAFCLLAASYALEMLANAYAQTGDSTIAADVVNYRSKSSEFSSRAKRYMQLYKEHIGIKDDGSTPAASAIIDSPQNYPGGSDRLTHPRWARRKR